MAAVALLLAGASGLLPRLVLTQATLVAALTMVLAPLCLLDRAPASVGRRWAVGPLPAFVLVAAGAIAIQLPAVAAWLAGGGPVALVALSALFLSAVMFWAVVIPQPGRVSGLYAAGYVIAGSVPLSMPALLLIMVPRDLYSALHAAAPPLLPAMTDQLLAGFVLFATVKISIFTAFSAMFRAAAKSEAATQDGDGRGDGGLEPPPAPDLPGWAVGLGPSSPAADELELAREVPARR